MPSSKLSLHTILRWARVLALAADVYAVANVAGCVAYGDPCLRITDCGSGLTCVEGKCVVDLGDNPPDSSSPSDAAVSGDASVSDTNTGGNGDVSGDDDAEGDSGDTGPDAQRDVGNADGAGALDARNDADVGDARAAVDGSAGGDTGGDVGADADSGNARDVALTDASDAAG